MAVQELGILSEADFLVRDPMYLDQKPYQLRYAVEGDFPESNMKDERKPITVHNFRPLQNAQSLDEYGFTTATLSRPLTAADFADKEKVVDSYYPILEEVLRKTYPDADKITFLENNFRNRHAQFPVRESYEDQQPSLLAHIDLTSKSAIQTAKAAFKMPPGSYKRLITINLWKSFQGPGNDWPLGLCDQRTFSRGRNSTAVDVVYHDSFTENESIYYSPDLRWYYFKDLKEDEVIAFIQTDSDREQGGGVPHVSFFNPEAAENAKPRRSIEVRAFVFFT